MSRLCQQLARIGFTLLASVGCLSVHAKEPVMTKTNSLCFGRFIVDLPEGAEIKEMGQQSEYMFGEIKSEHFASGADGFATKMKEREAELKAGKHKDGFKLTGSVSPTSDSRIFTLSRTYDLFPNDPPSTGLELYRLSNGQLFSMAGTGFNQSFPQIVERLKTNVIPHLRTRKLEEIPSEPGFCIRDGFIADDGSREQFEHARMQLNFKQWPDLWVKFTTFTVHKAGEETLFQRLAKHPETLQEKAMGFKTLRKAVHEVNGRKGEEILELMPTEQGFKQHSFTWEAKGALNQILEPDLFVEFESGRPLNGVPRRPSLTDEQAIKLFDSIVNSIRLRPTGGEKHSSIDKPKLPLGELAATGRVCPQTGWWQCAESGEVDGGRRQYFHAGDVMPRAVLLGEPSVWQKLKNERPTHKLATVWELVEYDAVPVAPTSSAETAPPQPNASIATNPETDAAKDAEPPSAV